MIDLRDVEITSIDIRSYDYGTAKAVTLKSFSTVTSMRFPPSVVILTNKQFEELKTAILQEGGNK